MFCVHFKLTSKPARSLAKAQLFSGIWQYVSKRYKALSAVEKPLENALALNIYDRIGHGRRQAAGEPKGDKSRINIVSRSLCDNVIRRLASSLKKYGGCDIIDVNPGAGLWSSKLHNAIKPRSHILLEPDFELYRPYLQPLLDKNDSTYKLIPESGILWDNLNLVKSGDYLGNQELLQMGDERLEKSNDSLLFIANLGYYPPKVYKEFPSISSLMLYQLLSAARTHSTFQQYGLVRMLIWMHDREKKAVYPRMITHRNKASIEAEISCEYVHEVAGSDEPASRMRREHELDLIGARRVLSKMRKMNIKPLGNRIGKLQAQVLQNSKQLKEDSNTGDSAVAEDLKEMEARYARREFCSYYDENNNPVYLTGTKRGPKGMPKTPEFLELRRLRWHVKGVNTSRDKAGQLVIEYESIMQKLDKLKEDDTHEAQEKREELQRQLSLWKVQANQLTPFAEANLWQRIDDRRAFHQDPPLLLWDRREEEPIMVLKDDFFPQQEMCLLDLQPKSIWEIFRGEKIANYDYFEFILSALFSSRTQSVISGLKALAPGADEWIIPRCPSLTDTAKGGLADLSHLSVRTLTQAMLREIIEAWMSWPFRPTKNEMISKLGHRGSWSGEEDGLETRD